MAPRGAVAEGALRGHGVDPRRRSERRPTPWGRAHSQQELRDDGAGGGMGGRPAGGGVGAGEEEEEEEEEPEGEGAPSQ